MFVMMRIRCRGRRGVEICLGLQVGSVDWGLVGDLDAILRSARIFVRPLDACLRGGNISGIYVWEHGDLISPGGNIERRRGANYL